MANGNAGCNLCNGIDRKFAEQTANIESLLRNLLGLTCKLSVAVVTQALGHDKFSVLGWSTGAFTALIAAAKNPDLINQLVVWGGTAFLSQQDVKIHQVLCDVSKWYPEIRKLFEEVYGAEGLAKTWGAWTDVDLAVCKKDQEVPNPWSICLELLPLISCPTLILHGGKDSLVPSFHPQFLLKHIKGSRLHLMPGAKHMFHVTQADEFNKLVEDFLED